MKKYESVELEAMIRRQTELTREFNEEQRAKQAWEESLRQEGRQQAWMLALLIFGVFLMLERGYLFLGLLVMASGAVLGTWRSR